MTRVTATYQGRVQGVGFRASVMSLAGFHNITGFVRNEDDGTVLVVAEGSDNEVRRFLDSISRSRLGPLINKTDLAFGPALGNFDCFDVRFG